MLRLVNGVFHAPWAGTWAVGEQCRDRKETWEGCRVWETQVMPAEMLYEIHPQPRLLAVYTGGAKLQV